MKTHDLKKLLGTPFNSNRSLMRNLDVASFSNSRARHPANPPLSSELDTCVRAQHYQNQCVSSLGVSVGLAGRALESYVRVKLIGMGAEHLWDAFVYGALLPSAVRSVISLDLVDYLNLFELGYELQMNVDIDPSGRNASSFLKATNDDMTTIWFPDKWCCNESIFAKLTALVGCESAVISFLPHKGRELIKISGSMSAIDSWDASQAND